MSARAAKREVLLAQRRAAAVISRTAMPEARAVFDAVSGATVRDVNRILREVGEVDAAIPRLRQFVLRRQQSLVRSLEHTLAEGTEATMLRGARSAGTLLGRVREVRSPLSSAEVLDKLVARRMPAMLAARQEAAESLGVQFRAAFAEELRNARAMQLTGKELVEALDARFDRTLSMVERTVATETSRAYNLAQRDAITLAAEEDPALRGRLFMRWTELVSDTTGQPLDRRVGEDSILLHGQVALPGGMFTMPDGPRVPRGMAGRSWPCPPNRPRDRATLVPWMSGWGIPGWTLQAGRKTRI